MSDDDMRALIARVEAASGPDREVDRAITDAVNYMGGIIYAPAFTASLDAAASLVPEGWWVGGVHYYPVVETWHVYLEAMGDMRADGEAATEQGARTAAALRARLAMQEGTRDE